MNVESDHVDRAQQYSSLTAFQRDCLLAIAQITGHNDQPYGLEIKRTLNDWYQEDINHGRLYPNLDELSEAGLISIGQLDERTNKYELTDEATDMLEYYREQLNRVLTE